MKTAHQRLASAALAATLALGTAAVAAAASVYTDYNHSTDFKQYHTFSIYRLHSGDPLMESRLRSDIEASLRDRGWQEVPQGGDVAITAISNVQNAQEYTTFYDGLGPGWGYGGWGGRWGWGGWGGRGWGWGGEGVATTRSQTVPVGTLAVDMYDTRTHQLVFRGTASDEFSTKHADTNDRKTAKEVDKIFDKLPKINRAG
ncbi:DUF4136 domain-containing protein [Terriglobus aquaticus]|uniref:DUF4136 domain-containing protein n=1 Tax=Terriglobus aquaticus TaxID=940139 RepID=A0ABW9KJ55_9BACT|nr:DUF4136 domain-containing protein [Terriglobus aquaticus]